MSAASRLSELKAGACMTEAYDIQSGAMMIREGFLLPDSAHLQSRSYSSTWRSLIGVDSFALDRGLSAAGWHLFFVAGEMKVMEWGRGAVAVRRGMKRLLARGCKASFNCMEITQVRPTYFLGFPCVAIRGTSFHIQNDAVLRS
jgi:hypothetical protein